MNLQEEDLLGPAGSARGGTVLWLPTVLSFDGEPARARGILGGPGTIFDISTEASSPPLTVDLVRIGDAKARPLTLMRAAATGLQDLLPGSVALIAAGAGEGGGGGGARTGLDMGSMALVCRMAAGFSCNAFRNAPCNSQH